MRELILGFKRNAIELAAKHWCKRLYDPRENAMAQSHPANSTAVDLSDPAVTQQNSSSCKRRKALYTAIALKISNRQETETHG
jgi:hypothetical protein